MNFYEFFAGGGMARIGLGPGWRCLLANDIDERKAASYERNFGKSDLKVDDIGLLKPSDLPHQADLAWASFPCQDLSLAGAGEGLKGKRSGTFWLFWRLMLALFRKGNAPRMIVIENVYGAITSHKGRDLAAICEALASAGYRFAPIVIDAIHFLPQSRPRLFIVAFGRDVSPPHDIVCSGPVSPWHPDAFGLAYDLLDEKTRKSWIWLRLPNPPARALGLSDLIEDDPVGVKWHTPFETRRLLSMMSPINLEKVHAAVDSREKKIGAVYKRTRSEGGVKKQRAEVRFDNIAGCLRTPAGGSSRQIILVVEGSRIRSRLLSPREAARLMGLPDSYLLPERYNDAYKLAGDGVAVPAVSWLSHFVLEPAIRAGTKKRRAA